MRAPAFRGSAGSRARARQQQPGTGGWHSGPTEHLHPSNMQHQHSGNKREGAYGEVAPPKDSPTARIRGGYSLWSENPPSRLCLGLPTVPATVACVYLGLAWPITGSVEAGPTRRSASAPHSTRAPPLVRLVSLRWRAHWLGQQGPRIQARPSSPSSSTSKLSLSSQVGKVARANKL